ncbi:MAG: 5-methyltetrahydropteroyltriglutamate--homocysteine S-methyltransferase [Burkholderiales bacterium]|nr:5-methyltetrahydropteroyltriglutamate--homocysteine S-methyltransferase [Burkholderiales bacterium]
MDAYTLSLNAMTAHRILPRKQKETEMTYKTMILGFPRIGENRELKKALENFWSKNSSLSELETTAKELRKKHWLEQKRRGIDLISSNDFSYYDNMLDAAVMLNAIPKRFRDIENKTERYFAMARGNNNASAMEMTKWFNTNYHYIVPELNDEIDFKLDAEKIIAEYREAESLGIKTKINIIGPLTFLALSKTTNDKDSYDYLGTVVSVYKQLFSKIAELGDDIVVQIDEPIFVKDLSKQRLPLIKGVYNELSHVNENVKIIVATYFEHACEAVKELTDTDVWGIALDFVYGRKNIDALEYLNGKTLIAGVIDGRNIWTTDFGKTLKLLEEISEKAPKEKIIISTCCSLLHAPYSVRSEPQNEIKQWLAFSIEKVEEVALLGKLFHESQLSTENTQSLEQNRKILDNKSNSKLLSNEHVAKRLNNIALTARVGDFNERITIQKKRLNLPLLPTTTIGSFPQTPDLRKIRLDFKKSAISSDAYELEIKKYIDECVSFQENIGLDVFVHGEPERNDMVEYFGELMNGFHFTQNGWVQSYGSRCVKPPVIYGDVSRPNPMTVKWITYAQSKTNKIMKGMLTGPVTIINWSFVRDDIPRSVIAKQIALALSDEIDDLQNAGIKIVQVDEAAFKEGYPLREDNIRDYEKWAVDSFKLAVSSAKKETQIHTHMCYSEFNDIIKTIENMDADVITIETARSGNKLLNIFKQIGYKNEIGPGVYDIHSPRIPSADEFKEQIGQRLQVLDSSKMWINPDCGLKTRKWEEVKSALKNMVQATLEIRRQYINR